MVKLLKIGIFWEKGAAGGTFNPMYFVVGVDSEATILGKGLACNNYN